MTDQETNLLNAFETTLTSEMGPTDLTATVASTSTMVSPSYVVIEPDSATQREYVLMDGAFTATSFVVSVIGLRYLTGSAAGSGLTHPIGSVIRSAAMQQHFEDLNDRIDALDHGDDLVGLGDDDHTQYHNDARAEIWHDADDHSDLEHDELTGLGDDDHTQYHNDARALTWLRGQEINELTDVIVTGPLETRDVLVHDGATGFVDRPLIEADISDLSPHRTDEEITDLAGNQVTGGVQTFITAARDDPNDEIDLTVPVIDDDSMATATDTTLATAESIKAYIDAQIALQLALAGGTMSGAIAMGAAKITGLAAATAAGDAVRMEMIRGLTALPIPIVWSKPPGAIVAETAAYRWTNNSGFDMTIIAVGAECGTAGVGTGNNAIDVNIEAVTCFTTQSNRPLLAAAAVEAVATTIQNAALADGETITIDIDEVTATDACEDLTVTVWAVFDI